MFKTKRSHIALAAALVTASFSASAGTFDFSGYMRAGTGVSLRGGSQVCFKLPGADTKWRLGNECDYVIEPVFDTTIAEYEGSQWHARVMPSVYKPWTEQVVGSNDLVARFGQAYIYGNKISALGNGTVWAGRRFYNRILTGINDQFLENNSGDGAGVEDMDVGIGKASVAFMLDPNVDPKVSTPNNARFSLPMRITGIKTPANGALSLYVTPSFQTRSRNQKTNTATPKEDNGISVGAYQTFGGTFGGETLLGVKYDKDKDGVKNTRAVIQQTAKLGARTQLDVLAEHRLKKDAAGLNSHWTGIGARADTHIAGPFRALVEVGHDRVKTDGADVSTMTKLTLAGAISAGGDPSSHPTLRVFVTHAVWNEAARKTLGANEGSRLVYGDRTSGTSVGVQVDSWW